jgi:hypothetical protein
MPLAGSLQTFVRSIGATTAAPLGPPTENRLRPQLPVACRRPPECSGAKAVKDRLAPGTTVSGGRAADPYPSPSCPEHVDHLERRRIAAARDFPTPEPHSFRNRAAYQTSGKLAGARMSPLFPGCKPAPKLSLPNRPPLVRRTAWDRIPLARLPAPGESCAGVRSSFILVPATL